MKYWIFAAGLVFILMSTVMMHSGAVDGFDATFATLPGVVGFLLTASAVGIHAYDNYVRTEEGRRRR